VNNKKRKKIKKNKIPVNEIREEEVELFLNTIQQLNEYVKIRDLQKIFKDKLDLIKINTILKYLERSKTIEVDLDGNIIWIKRNINRQLNVWEKASISRDFKELYK
jgi:hypothetical protein